MNKLNFKENDVLKEFHDSSIRSTCILQKMVVGKVNLFKQKSVTKYPLRKI